MKLERLNVKELKELGADYGIQIPARFRDKMEIISYLSEKAAPFFGNKQTELTSESTV